MKSSVFFGLIFLCIVSAQSDISFSYEMKYGNGDQDTYGNAFFENLLDANGTLNPTTTFYAQLEYSDPPLFGTPQTALNKIYFDYTNGNLTATLGDLFKLYGYGLAVNLNQDQNLGYDNTLRGASMDYSLGDQLRIFGLIGQGNYEYALNASTGLFLRNFDNKLGAFGLEYGDFTFLLAQQKSFLSEDLLMVFYTPDPLTTLEEELSDRIVFEDIAPDTIKTNKFEVMYAATIGPVDVYVERLWSRYNKILGEKVNGSMLYTSAYADLFGWGITWDYKDYDMEFNLPSLSNPPIVFREASSTLVGRVTHLLNYNDERGHQVEINRNFGDAVNFLGNWSFSRRQSGAGLADQYSLHYTDMGDSLDFFWESDTLIHTHFKAPSMWDVASFNLSREDHAFYPFSEIYFEFSGDLLDDNFHWVAGYDYLNDVTKYHHQHVHDTGFESFDTSALTDSIQTHFDTYWWSIWGQNYLPEYGLDSTYADEVFLNVYDMAVQDKIGQSVDYSTTSAENVISAGGNLDKVIYNYERVEAYTIPTNFAYNFGGGNSVTLYLEFQKKRDISTVETYYPATDSTDSSFSGEIKYSANYTALTWRLKSRWSFTILRDWENRRWYVGGNQTNKIDKTWTGYEFSWDITPENQLTIFYGSLKGGRICANGICADQPDFSDGIKVTYRAIF